MKSVALSIHDVCKGLHCTRRTTDRRWQQLLARVKTDLKVKWKHCRSYEHELWRTVQAWRCVQHSVAAQYI